MTPSIGKRFPENPLIQPKDVKPDNKDFIIESVFNPGAFTYKQMVGLLCRVTERPVQKKTCVSTPIITAGLKKEVLSFSLKDPGLTYDDPRKFTYNGKGYLTTLSHLRLAWSEDGKHFTVNDLPTIEGYSSYESFGVEDCRVTEIAGIFYLTYTAVSDNGVAVGLISTSDWINFNRHGLIFPPHNKDCSLFPEKINDSYHAFHRPAGILLGGSYIWLSDSTDLLHWGNHLCIAKTREGMWDCERVGVNGPPIKTDKGWLVLYHGADNTNRYCIGAMLCDTNNPSKVIARTGNPIFEPDAEYEKEGFFGNVVFSAGHIVKDDDLTLYYGAADTTVCAASFSVRQILELLMEKPR